MRAERSDAGSAQGRGYPSPRSGSSAPRSRPADRDRPAAGRRPPAVRDERDDEWGYDNRRPTGRDRVAERGAERRTAAPPRSPRPDRAAAQAPARRDVATAGPHLRGSVAVLGMFAVTLLAAGADSFIGVGLGTVTLLALLVASVGACLLVRRRDLLSVVVAPPLVFLGVALVNIVLAPSATFSLPTLATLLIRGFPAMAIGVGAAVLVALVRLATRR